MGKHRGMYPEMKLALFQGLVNLINEHKSYSISVMVSQADFTSQLTKEVQKTLIGPYALAFFSAIVVNNEWARRQNPGNRVAYLIDEGSSHTEQLLSAHAVVASVEKTPGEFCYTGTIALTIGSLLSKPLMSSLGLLVANRYTAAFLKSSNRSMRF